MNLQIVKPRARQITKGAWTGGWMVGCDIQRLWVTQPTLDAAIQFFYESSRDESVLRPAGWTK